MKIGLYLDGDSGEFPDQAIEWSKETGATCFPIRNVGGLLDVAARLPPRSIEHLSIFAHGTTNGLGKPGRWGIDLRPARWMLAPFIGPEEFADSWSPLLAPGALVSLAACLCGRSQHWYLQGRFGKLAATYATPWGQESYEHGGATSLAHKLMRALNRDGLGVRVRAHCAAGHCTHQALLREFRPGLTQGLSLFRLVVGPTTEWTIARRNRWQAAVKGPTAERYLLALDTDDTFVATVRAALHG